MKRSLALLALALLPACADGAPPLSPDAPAMGRATAADGRYIVVLRPGADPRAVAAVVGVHPRVVFTAAVNGFASELNAGQLAALRHMPAVAYVEPDGIGGVQTTQTPVTWGIDRIDQANLPLSNTFTYTSQGRGVRIYVLDSGVRKTHADLAGRVQYVTGGVNGNFVGDAYGSAEDCHGHGTHVAATAAGTTWGVAKLAPIRAARVVYCNGSGSASMAIAAMDWIVLNGTKPAVVNMSLGYGNVQSVRDAAEALYAAGYVPVAAAGNGSPPGTPANACAESPAGATNALTVGATDITDQEASFSNFGRCVDLLAPGVAVKSAGIATDTSTYLRSGTSMAAPHAAGVAAQYLYANPTATPLTVMSYMKSTATVGVITLSPNSITYHTPNRLLFTGL